MAASHSVARIFVFFAFPNSFLLPIEMVHQELGFVKYTIANGEAIVGSSTVLN
jgi:hypothetical protein